MRVPYFATVLVTYRGFKMGGNIHGLAIITWFKYRLRGNRSFGYTAKYRWLDLERSIKSNSDWLHRSGIRPFFISQIIENRKSRKAGLLRHYDILKQNVLSYWEEERSELSTNIGLSYPESLIPLYVDILSRIRKPRYFNQLRCHLKDEKYREIENIISDIEKSEPEHNEKVAYLMNNMRGNIRTTMFEARNGALQTSREISSLREYDKADPNYEPHFVSIISYC